MPSCATDTMDGVASIEDEPKKPIPMKRTRFPEAITKSPQNSISEQSKFNNSVTIDDDDDDEPPPVPPRRESRHPRRSSGSGRHSSRSQEELEELTHDEQTLNQTLNDAGNRIVTLTGTIKRGSKHGQAVEVQLKLSENELRRLSTVVDPETLKQDRKTYCGLKKGLHILIMSIVCIPFMFIASTAFSFYVGTMTWYNFYLYYSEEKTILHKIMICPLLIIFYPVMIVLSSLAMGLYSMFIQVSWFYDSWQKEVRDMEKGFYGWLCSRLNLPDLSPYEVVVLDEDGEIHEANEDESDEHEDDADSSEVINVEQSESSL